MSWLLLPQIPIHTCQSFLLNRDVMNILCSCIVNHILLLSTFKRNGKDYVGRWELEVPHPIHFSGADVAVLMGGGLHALGAGGHESLCRLRECLFPYHCSCISAGKEDRIWTSFTISSTACHITSSGLNHAEVQWCNHKFSLEYPFASFSKLHALNCGSR